MSGYIGKNPSGLGQIKLGVVDVDETVDFVVEVEVVLVDGVVVLVVVLISIKKWSEALI